jgi:hypothetical protein
VAAHALERGHRVKLVPSRRRVALAPREAKRQQSGDCKREKRQPLFLAGPALHFKYPTVN